MCPAGSSVAVKFTILPGGAVAKGIFDWLVCAGPWAPRQPQRSRSASSVGGAHFIFACFSHAIMVGGLTGLLS